MTPLRLKYLLKAIITPSCWLRVKKTNKEWDNYLWNSLLTDDITIIGSHEILINDCIVWIANAPYASGTLRIRTDFANVDHDTYHCGRSTSLLLRDELKKAKILFRLRGPHNKYEIIEKYGIVIS